MLTQKQKTQALYLKDLINSSSWRVYEEFVRDFIFDFVGSAYDKNVFTGLKLAISEPRKLVEEYEKMK